MLVGISLQAGLINSHFWVRYDELIPSARAYSVYNQQLKITTQKMLGHFSLFNFIYCFSWWKLIADSLYSILYLHRKTRKGKKPTGKKSSHLEERRVNKEGEALTLYPITSDSLARGLTGSHPRDTWEPSCIHIILLGAWLGAKGKKKPTCT